MAAAVNMLRGRRETHVVVLRPRRLRPFAVHVNGEPVMAREYETLAVGAVGESMHVHERDFGMRGASDEQEHSSNHPRNGHSCTLRSRSAFDTTDTELIAIAAPAKIGESSSPKNG